MTFDLFGFEDTQHLGNEMLGKQAIVLRAFALPYLDQAFAALHNVINTSPLRQMVTPGGYTMSVTTTSCGQLGWVSDQDGYRYSRLDPHTGKHWPDIPASLLMLAADAANTAGFPGFVPDACLINRYLPEAKMSLHQDKNELDMAAPIVSVSLGMPAVFLFGGHKREDKTQRVSLFHGDVTVWGGVDRLRFHGVLPVKSNPHPVLGEQRINLTFRKAG